VVGLSESRRQRAAALTVGASEHRGAAAVAAVSFFTHAAENARALASTEAERPEWCRVESQLALSGARRAWLPWEEHARGRRPNGACWGGRRVPRSLSTANEARA